MPPYLAQPRNQQQSVVTMGRPPPPSLRPYDWYRVAHAARLNAVEYVEQAELLASREWWGRALALSVLGGEEGGKAFYCQLLALGILPVKHDSYSMVFEKHWSKQALASMGNWVRVLADIAPIASSFRAFASEAEALDRSGVPPTPDRVAAIAARMRQTFEHQTAVHDKELHERIRPIEQEFSAIKDERVLEKAKWRGLYVDLDPESLALRVPRDVTKQEYEVQREPVTRVLTCMPLLDGPLLDEWVFDAQRAAFAALRQHVK